MKIVKEKRLANMADNKLPNGVGKKIVQALKKQAEIEIKAVPDEPVISDDITPVETEEVFDTSVTDDINLEDGFSDFSNQNGFFPEPEPLNLNAYEAPVDDTPFNADDYNFGSNEEISFEQEEVFKPNKVQPSQPQMHQPVNHTMPSNVAVLKRLITQLPGGVTKQTGAQIIRQTMEALGISMNSVLKEAQQVQDSLNDSARTCMTSIQEYKNNIRSLEKQVQDYKKQAVALNDLISLFVLTDKR